ncbi:MAG TPA: hypothetical protein DCF68_04695 [Cyanothece sp. UBA12306]|nr:hypothetical protein [Cyanothece sp. UBA12306]
MNTYPTFQEAIDTVEALPLEQQIMLIEIIQNRLRERKRTQLLENVEQAEQDYHQGNINRGSVANLMAELDE